MPKAKQFDEVQVMNTAKEVFSEKGYNGTSMDDLVQATGLSRSSIYDTFGDKHGLFLKVLTYYRGDQQNDLATLLAKTDSPKKKIAIVFDNIVRDILADKDRKGCLLINVSMELNCVDKDVANLACTNMLEMEEQFAKWLKEGQAKGEIGRKFPPKVLAKHLYNSLTGLRMTGRTRPEQGALRDVVKVALSILDE
jgi:TetR/AcrR family transcriptional regulator, transcriptional repressor for nem operon